MCGFAGFLDSENHCEAAVLSAAVRRMVGTLHHRGPDDVGTWVDANAGIVLGHCRLAVLDLSPAGHQPMFSPSGRYVTVFNGEIYNHSTLRGKLQDSAESVVWKGQSDTETMLACFDRWGIRETLVRTVGMFSFAVWDKHERVLVLARDRLGEKPLYYGWQGRTFLFGSELKALRAHTDFLREIDRSALHDFVRFGYIPAPHSIYRGIRKLRPGTFLVVRPEERAERPAVPYWSLLDVCRQGLAEPLDCTDEEAIDALESRLYEAVKLQQIADVPVGAFLSGGIDSSTIVAVMQNSSSRPVNTFTIGFDDKNYDEAAHARVVARHLGTHHTELYVQSGDALAVIPKLAEIYDEPFADVSGIPTYLVSKLARGSVTVSLSGDGGDELFGGYNRYLWARRLMLLSPSARKVAASMLTAFSPRQWDSIYAFFQPLAPKYLRLRMPGHQAHKLSEVLSAASESDIYQALLTTWRDHDNLIVSSNASPERWPQGGVGGGIEERMMSLDTLSYLPDDILCKVDRAAMAVSLETRVPFLDHRIVEYAWRLPLRMKIRNGQTKWILRQLLERYVPKDLTERPKMGFAVPIESWLRGSLRGWSQDLLSERRLRAGGYIRPGPVIRKLEEHLSGRRNWQYHLWNVLMFQAWLDAGNP